MDAREGRVWIARAAGAGMAEAEVALAEMMVSGDGGRRDPFTARALLEKAAQKGHVGAMSALRSSP
jgi:TPR repeat protein